MSHNLNIGFGPEVEFYNGGEPGKMEAHPLGDTRFFVSYIGAAAHGTVSIGNVVDSVLTFGSGNIFKAGTTRFPSSDRLEDDKIVVAYVDWDQSQHGTAQIGTASGTTMVFGPEFEFLVGVSDEIKVASLSATKFVVTYRDESDSNHGTAKIGTVSGTTITFGPETEFVSSGGIAETWVSRLNDDKFVVAYRNEANANKGEVIIGSVFGTSISFGTAVEYSTDGRAPEIGVFNEDKFVLVDEITDSAAIGHVSGTVITFDADEKMSPPVGWNTPAVGIFDQDNFITAFRDRSDNNRGSAVLGHVVGPNTLVGPKSLFNEPNNGTASTQIHVVNPSQFVVMYQDDSDFGHGIAKVGTLSFSIGAFDFFLNGPQAFPSPDLHIFMSGGIEGVPQPDPFIRVINRLTKIHDYDPQLVTKFIGIPNNVDIEVWDITNGNNMLVTVANSGCYSIGDTNRWAWSTEHLPFLRNKYHYAFRMTSNLGEQNTGEFLINVPEGGLWSSPD